MLEPVPLSKIEIQSLILYRKAAEAFKLSEKWAATSAAKKFAVRAKRASLNDLDRFKVMINRKNRSFQVRKLAKKISSSKK